MALIEWRESYATGIAGVDYEHEELVKTVNDIYAKLEQGADKDNIVVCLNDIYGQISSHFALEEQEMKKREYDQYEEHTDDHEKLLDDIRDITAEVQQNEVFDAEGLQKKLDDWFLIHFKTHDARLHKLGG